MFKKPINKFLLIFLILAIVGLACGGAAPEVADETADQATRAAEEVEKAVDETAKEAEEAAKQAKEAAEKAADAGEEVADAAEKAADAGEEVADAVSEEVEEAAEEALGDGGNTDESQTAEGETEEAEVEMGSIKDTLSTFTSYRTQFTIEFDGTDAEGQATAGKMEMLLEYVQEPKAMHMDLGVEGSMAAEMGGAAEIKIYNVDNTLYMQNPEDGSWMSFPSGDDESGDPFSEGFFSPDDMIKDFPTTGRRSLLPQTVNGISTWHYEFTEDDIKETDFQAENGLGELWIARDGEYPVKFVIEANGISNNPDLAEFFETGNIKITYDLLDVNGDFEIVVPEEALNASGLDDLFGNTDPSEVEFPITEDAEIDFNMEGMLSYHSNLTIAEIADFYKAQLDAEGWTADETLAFVSEDSGLLQYTNDTTELLISLSLEEDGRISVNLISSEKEE